MDISGELVDAPQELASCRRGDTIGIKWCEEGSAVTQSGEFLVDSRHDLKPGWIIYGDVRPKIGQHHATIFLRDSGNLIIID